MRSGSFRQSTSNCYRLAAGVRVAPRDSGGLAICAYPLRVVRLSQLSARLLQACSEERTCEQLADLLHLPARRAELLCEQLRWKGLLEAGAPLAPREWPAISIIIASHNRAQQLAGIIFPPLLLAALLQISVVVGVDYARLRPDMRLGEYAFCSVLDDCAYEIGVLHGCIKYATWRPLLPLLKKSKR
jgi:hypothetical protein